MQVSWIDPDEIAKLAAQLHGPLELDESPSWDINTLPDISNESSLQTARDSFNHLADSLDAQAPEAIENAGQVPTPEIEHIREKLRSIRARAMHSGMIAHPVAETASQSSEVKIVVPSIPLSQLPITISLSRPVAAQVPVPRPTPFLPLEGPIADRLAAFMKWASQIVPCEDRLLMDDHGDMLWGGSARSELALSAILAVTANQRAGTQAMASPAAVINSRLGANRELSVLPCPTRFGMVTLALLNAPPIDDETAACLREALTLCIEGKGAWPEH
ncbi:MAG: hypothetical protein WCN98_19715 [Verrucomicrobiaceae bacterium]